MTPHYEPTILAAASIVASWVLIRVGAILGVTRRECALLILICTVSAYLGARIYGVVDQWAAHQPISMSLLGLRYPGGVAGVILGGLAARRWVMPRHGIGKILDLFILPLLAGMAVARLSCFITGCCGGIETSLPWAVRYGAGTKIWAAQVAAGVISVNSARTTPVHPLQLYFMAWAAIVAGLMAFKLRHRTFDGEVFLLGIMLHDAGKGLLETLRFEFQPDLQMMAFASVVAAALTYGVLQLRYRKTLRAKPRRTVWSAET